MTTVSNEAIETNQQESDTYNDETDEGAEATYKTVKTIHKESRQQHL